MEKNITVLNVTGEEGETGGHIHQDVMDVLESVIYLEHTEYNNPIKTDFSP